jgi:hypothetical protein
MSSTCSIKCFYEVVCAFTCQFSSCNASFVLSAYVKYCVWSMCAYLLVHMISFQCHDAYGSNFLLVCGN